ncbi:probable 2-oxoglutarate-dependent dioxygenase SLC1 [Mercurialis annua]|uniref:probable 2-oxoglutarate-dependent dioxygenase SLC1 n=1 Tax=Mercurialis annua TaxID=3986 RepID=UPI002160C35A|nr:probable 2-oxoglutarate-dependent dioxygenase SLC1 [Mercurialis annua]
MSPTIAMTGAIDDDVALDIQYQKGVKRLCEKGITKVPNKYILPIQDRPITTTQAAESIDQPNENLKLPIIDFAELQGENRSQVLKSLADACEQYGFFQLVNHGIPDDVISGMVDLSKRFFELPYEERSNYMSSDMKALVRYGTSFNQIKDNVFCWRDFLKLMCNPLPDVLPHWPSSPPDFRDVAATYAKESKHLFLMVMEAILESLGSKKCEEDEIIMKDFEKGSQLMVLNHYPKCPQPELTLGMPPHSDYGALTLLLQDEVEGLQICYEGKWVTVDPIPNAFVINVGDHLEIFSNGKYKSVLHRVKVNSAMSRTSVASLHTFPLMRMVKPWPKLIDEANPECYQETNFANFLDYISSREPKNKEFLESRKIVSRNSNP